jgi:hypothetical protein
VTFVKDGKRYRRTPETLDCWFESGSMPYGQKHYPFENKAAFEANFPADFIAEGLDQTRAWFYYLLVLSTALFDKPAFKNVVVNGLVLAEHGRKIQVEEELSRPHTHHRRDRRRSAAGLSHQLAGRARRAASLQRNGSQGDRAHRGTAVLERALLLYHLCHRRWLSARGAPGAAFRRTVRARSFRPLQRAKPGP